MAHRCSSPFLLQLLPLPVDCSCRQQLLQQRQGRVIGASRAGRKRTAVRSKHFIPSSRMQRNAAARCGEHPGLSAATRQRTWACEDLVATLREPRELIYSEVVPVCACVSVSLSVFTLLRKLVRLNNGFTCNWVEVF